MSLQLRDWATPLVSGAFLLSAVTGILIFFHWDTDLNKAAHEWLGWALVVGAAAHLTLHFAGFKKRLQAPLTKAIIGIFVVILGLSFLPLGGEDDKAGGGVKLVMESLLNAPVSAVAAVAQKDVPTALADLQNAGIPLTSADQTLTSVCQGERPRCMAALEAVLRK